MTPSSCNRPFLLFCLCLWLAAMPAKAQTARDSAYADSLKNAVLLENTRYIKRLDSLRTADSLERMRLQQQIGKLKTTDNIKKEELLARLDSLRTADANRIAAKRLKIDSLRRLSSGFPVAPFGDTILAVYTRLGPMSPQARAKAIETKIRLLEDDHLFNGDSIIIFRTDQAVDLFYGDLIILSITEEDALWQTASQEELAERYKAAIAKSIAAYREATSLQTLLKEIVLALLVVALGIVIVLIINRLFRLLKFRIAIGRGKLFRGIKIRNYEIVTAANMVRAVTTAVNLLRWLVILLVVYLMLPGVFSIFPWTQNIADRLIDYVLNPVRGMARSLVDYLPNLITIIVIIAVFRYIVKGLRFLKNEVARGALVLPNFYPEWANPTFQLIRVLVFAFMLIVIFPYLPGSDSPVFKGVSVFLGVLFTLSSSSSLSNIVAGFVLTYMRAFKLGDRVKIGDHTGDIIEKTLLVTRIRTIKNEEVTIPNSTVMGSHTVNFSASAPTLGLVIHTTVTIGYDVPWRQVHHLLISAALETDTVLNDPLPFVLQTSLDDFYVSYQVNAFTREPNMQAVIYSILHQKIQDKFNEAGVEIMSPHYRAARDGNMTTVPPQYLPPDYVPPGFRVDRQGGI